MKDSLTVVENPQSWLTIERCIRPMLAELDFEPATFDSALAVAKRVHDACQLDRRWCFEPKGRKARAAWAFVADIAGKIDAFHRTALVGLLFEVAVREAQIQRCSCGAAKRAGLT